MTAPGLDERQHATAIKAAIKAQIGAWEVYEHGQVPGADGNPGSVPTQFVLIQVERRYLPPSHSVRQATRSGWRTTVSAIGSSVAECRWMVLKVTTALDGKRLTVGAYESTPIQFESGDTPESRNGEVESLSRWTYSL